MYEVKLNIEEAYLLSFLKYLETVQTVQIERVIKKRKNTRVLSKNERISQSLAPSDPLRAFIKPLREHLTKDDIKREQKYKGTDWHKIDLLAKELDIQEPLEVLFEQLKS